MSEHSFPRHDPVTAQEIPESDGPLLATTDNSMTLAFEESIKQPEADYLKHIDGPLEITPHPQASAQRVLDSFMAAAIQNDFHMIYTSTLRGNNNEYANCKLCSNHDCPMAEDAYLNSMEDPGGWTKACLL